LTTGRHSPKISRRGDAVQPQFGYFWLGVGGAFTAYFALYRESRFQDFFLNPRKHWSTLVFDLVFFLFCGGLVATFLIEPRNTREAFMAGVSWQGLIGGVLAGSQLKDAKQSRSVRRSSKGGKTR
jgi:hypothetical protein